MSFTTVNPVAAGQKARKSHFDALFANAIALKEARATHVLGGSFESAVSDTSFVSAPGSVFVEIDGTNLGGLTVEVHVMAKVVGGTGTIQLFNRTLAVAVASSSATFTNTSPALIKTGAITLATGVNVYELQVKGNVGTDLPTVWGGKVVLR